MGIESAQEEESGDTETATDSLQSKSEQDSTEKHQPGDVNLLGGSRTGTTVSGASVQRSARTGGGPGATGGQSYTDYDAGPDHEGLAMRYGLDFCKRGQAERVQRLEQEFGSHKVQRWVDEGMTVEAMGKPRDMEAFRKRKANRSEEIPNDIERGNQASVQRNKDADQDAGPAGDVGAPDEVRRVISKPGTSMDETVQREMESKMGGDFSDVRVHTGPEAAAAADSINARAFTVGNHVAFNDGEYDPGSDSGKKLLAHELTHVRQQNEGRVSLLPKTSGEDGSVAEPLGCDYHIQPKLTVSSPDDPAEKEADRVANEVVQSDGHDGLDPDTSTSSMEKPTGRVETSARNSSNGEETPLSSERESVVRTGISGGGEPLPSDIREEFETTFRTDLSDVSIHTGRDADQAAGSINAEAFTLGSDIAFANGKFDTESTAGRKLLAHELTHVVQSGSKGQAATMVSRHGVPREYFDDIPERGSSQFGPDIDLQPDSLASNYQDAPWDVEQPLQGYRPTEGEIDEGLADDAASHIETLGSDLEERRIEVGERYDQQAETFAQNEAGADGNEAVEMATMYSRYEAKAAVPDVEASMYSDYATICAAIVRNYEFHRFRDLVYSEEVPHPNAVHDDSDFTATPDPPATYSHYAGDDRPTSHEIVEGFLRLVAWELQQILANAGRVEDEEGSEAAGEQRSRLNQKADGLWQATHHTARDEPFFGIGGDDPDGIIGALSGLQPVEGPAIMHIYNDRVGVEEDVSRDIHDTINSAWAEQSTRHFYVRQFFVDAAMAFLNGDVVTGARLALEYAARTNNEDLAELILREFRRSGLGDSMGDEETLEAIEHLQHDAYVMNSGEIPTASVFDDVFEDNDTIQALMNPDLEDDEALRQADAMQLYDIFDSWTTLSDSDTEEIYEILEARADNVSEQEKLERAYRRQVIEEEGIARNLRDDLEAMLDDSIPQEVASGLFELGSMPVSVGMEGFAAVRDDMEVWTRTVSFVGDDVDESTPNQPFYDRAIALLDGELGRAQAAKLAIAGLEDDPEAAFEIMNETHQMDEFDYQQSRILEEMEEYFDDVEIELEQGGTIQTTGRAIFNYLDEQTDGVDIETEDGITMTGHSAFIGAVFEEDVTNIVSSMFAEEGPQNTDAPVEILLWCIEEEWFIGGGFGVPDDVIVDALEMINEAENTEEQWRELMLEARRRDNNVDDWEDIKSILNIDTLSSRESYEARSAYESIVFQIRGADGTLDELYRMAELDWQFVSNNLTFEHDPGETPQRIEELWGEIEDTWERRDEWAELNPDVEDPDGELGAWVGVQEGEEQTRQEFVENCQQLGTWSGMWDARRESLTSLASSAIQVTIATVGSVAMTVASAGSLGPAAKAAIGTTVSAFSAAGEVAVQQAGYGAISHDQAAEIAAQATVSAAVSAGTPYWKNMSFIKDLGKQGGLVNTFLQNYMENIPAAFECLGDVEMWEDGDVPEMFLYGLTVHAMRDAGAEAASESIAQGIFGEQADAADIAENIDSFDSSDIDEGRLGDLMEEASVTNEIESAAMSEIFSGALREGSANVMEDTFTNALDATFSNDTHWSDLDRSAMINTIVKGYASGAIDAGTNAYEIANTSIDEVMEEARSAQSFDSLLMITEGPEFVASSSFVDHMDEQNTAIDVDEEVELSDLDDGFETVTEVPEETTVETDEGFDVRIEQSRIETIAELHDDKIAQTKHLESAGIIESETINEIDSYFRESGYDEFRFERDDIFTTIDTEFETLDEESTSAAWDVDMEVGLDDDDREELYELWDVER